MELFFVLIDGVNYQLIGLKGFDFTQPSVAKGLPTGNT